MSAALESDEYMHVLSRRTLCGFCMRKRATYDVAATQTELGLAGDWRPSCGPCARRFRERLKWEARERQLRREAR